MQKTIKGYPLLVGYLGIFIAFTGILMCLPLLMLFAYPNEASDWWKFAVPGVCAFILGFLLTLILRGKKVERMQRFEDALFIVFMWAITIWIASAPFILNGADVTRSVFEVTAGISTTGMSTFVAENMSHMFLFYRSVLMFFGGIGLVLVITSTISDRYGMRLYQAEGHNDKLMSNLAKSARLILSIYAGYILVGTVSFILFGMDWFEALNHSISAVATGGFSPKNGSIGAYRSLVSQSSAIGIEITAMILMLLGATSFAIHAFLFRGEIKKLLKHNEFHLFISVFVVSLVLVALNLNTIGGETLEFSFRDSAFTLISAITTTGLQVIPSVKALPSLTFVVIIILMIIGGQLGSTAGAIKQGRISLALKSSYWYIRDKMSHSRTVRTNFIARYGTYDVVTDVEIRHNYAFIFMYGLILLIGAFIFMGFGNTFDDSLFEIASLLGSTGYSTGIIHANAPLAVLWTGIVAMFVGRLEFTVVVIAAVKILSDIRHKEII